LYNASLSSSNILLKIIFDNPKHERTKELHAKYKTKTFLEKNYYAISENLMKKIVEENRLF